MSDLWKIPRRRPYVDAFVNILIARRRLVEDFTPFFKSHGLTEPKYDVLWILRRAGKEGVPCAQIGERLYTRVPDVTRLVDGLEQMELVKRERDTNDRRVVRVSITTKGLKLMNQLDEPVQDIHKLQFQDLSKSEIEALNEILPKLASTPVAETTD